MRFLMKIQQVACWICERRDVERISLAIAERTRDFPGSDIDFRRLNAVRVHALAEVGECEGFTWRLARCPALRDRKDDQHQQDNQPPDGKLPVIVGGRCLFLGHESSSKSVT